MELQQTAQRYHRTGSWIAAVLNILFALNDWAVIPEMAFQFAVLRVFVSLCIVTVLVFQKQLAISAQQLVLVPFALISLENAYMWSFMGQELFQMHSLAYVALFLGASMIVLWSWHYSLLILVISLLGNSAFLHMNSNLPLNQIMANGGTLVCAVALISTFFIQKRYAFVRREVILRLRLAAGKERINSQKVTIEKNHEMLTSSIRYSQRIQQAMMPSDEALRACISDSFVFLRPRDIVSGDFYWCFNEPGKVYIAAVDCTGHGVPGALMSMLGSTLLNKVMEDGERNPARILTALRAEVISALNQHHGSGSKDGMDIALCMIDQHESVIKFAGAFNPMYLLRQGQFLEVKGDRMPIGIHMRQEQEAFTLQEVRYEAGDMIYLFSDGYVDQFGGEADRKFGKARFKELLGSIASMETGQQREELRRVLDEWQGQTAPIDDILVLGFRLS